ncbi:MAG: hypothetical protein M0R48_00500 [Candidatus Omnitrophica bacterium]|nr:hypothetical protein [Candidatus Omnitrophota bacterium]
MKEIKLGSGKYFFTTASNSYLSMLSKNAFLSSDRYSLGYNVSGRKLHRHCSRCNPNFQRGHC